MSHRFYGIVWLVIVFLQISFTVQGNEYIYQDDDLLCGSGFTPESYYQKIRDHEYQQRAAYIDNQHRIAYETAAAQRAHERIKMARKSRIEKEVRQREELIAKRKAAKAAKESSTSSLTSR